MVILVDPTPRQTAIGEDKHNMKSIIIIGSGAAAALMVRQLLKTGDCQITMFEAGPDFTRGYRKWLDFLMRENNLYEKFWDDQRVENEHFGLRGSRLFMKGGTTNHWG